MAISQIDILVWTHQQTDIAMVKIPFKLSVVPTTQFRIVFLHSMYSSSRVSKNVMGS